MIIQDTLKNYIAGQWEPAAASGAQEVHNPATGEVIAAAPLSGRADVDKAVRAAGQAWQTWRRVPPGERIQPLFRLKALLDAQFSDIAKLIVQECGKTLAASRTSRSPPAFRR
jgi:malonate-semialdehyde dehydrogenase (acetylating)/methylmalonate-semialdehyde dehydrogenase